MNSQIQNGRFSTIRVGSDPCESEVIRRRRHSMYGRYFLLSQILNCTSERRIF
jgi:hypothetical protein